MNPKINSYVNFLLEDKPSPFCEYILLKELLPFNQQDIHDAYDWAIRFRQYTVMGRRLGQCNQPVQGQALQNHQSGHAAHA